MQSCVICGSLDLDTAPRAYWDGIFEHQCRTCGTIKLARRDSYAVELIQAKSRAEKVRDILAERLAHAAFDKFPNRSAKDWIAWAEKKSEEE